MNDIEILSYQFFCYVYSRCLNNVSISVSTYCTYHSRLKVHQCFDKLLQRYNQYIMFSRYCYFSSKS